MTDDGQQAYKPSLIEKKWQKAWEDQRLFQASDNPRAKKCYVLEQFPYPSGRLHMGHLRLYTLGDVLARYKGAQGFTVMHPMGWDAFGLPAENAAIENKIHPAKWTHKNIENMRGQLKAVGLSYDWAREIATCDPGYYQHEQKMFLDFYKAGIAYRKESMVNWDPVDNTVLANEQVIDGKGWRSGVAVERKKLTQWFLKITDFAADLLDGLTTLPGWPAAVLTMQEKWIGKSEGALIDFKVLGESEGIRVYTTRPETIFGASFVAISPNHPLALKLGKHDKKIGAFIEECNKLGVAEEAIEKAEKKGFDTGLKAIHPFGVGELPIYIANFVLMEYGTGALFGCPAHDQRDFEFAQKYNLPILRVISGSPRPLTEAYVGDGVMMDSGFLNGLTIDEARKKAIAQLKEMRLGEGKINYRLRDWGVSRQRYWGCPIPIIHCEKCGVVPVPAADLPVTLPEDVDFDTPGNPLDRHPTWKHVKCPECGGKAVRETDTFDTFFESSWYFARFCSPHSAQAFDKKSAESWLPVDYYLGGIEHAVLHLLYSRFFMRALEKCGYTNIKEPFKGLVTQGMVCRETYKDKNGKWLEPEEALVLARNHMEQKLREAGITPGKDAYEKAGIVTGRIEKMSKSKKNVVSPEAILEKYGADTARLFMLSDSPPERDLEWSDTGIEGASRFLHRLWKMAEEFKSQKPEAGNQKISKLTHKTIAAVTEHIEKFQLNSAVAKIRELFNAIADAPPSPETRAAFQILLQLFYPLAPHISEEIWESLGNKTMLAKTPWPVADKSLLADDMATIAIQVNGKLRGTVELPVDAVEDVAKTAALAVPALQAAVGDKPIRKVIYVPNRILNVVV